MYFKLLQNKKGLRQRNDIEDFIGELIPFVAVHFVGTSGSVAEPTPADSLPSELGREENLVRALRSLSSIDGVEQSNLLIHPDAHLNVATQRASSKAKAFTLRWIQESCQNNGRKLHMATPISMYITSRVLIPMQPTSHHA